MGEVAFEVVAPPSGPLIDLSANVGLDLDGSADLRCSNGNLGGTEVLTINGTRSQECMQRPFPCCQHLRPGTGSNGIIKVSSIRPASPERSQPDWVQVAVRIRPLRWWA